MLTRSRKRRIKCDEQFPSCRACERRGLPCSGVRQVVFTNEIAKRSDASDLTPSILALDGGITPLSNRSPREIRAFKWLVTKSANDATNQVDRAFWANAVPRVAQVDDMVWYGVAALATLFEHPPEATSRVEPFGDLDSGDFYRRQALEWYGRSLQSAHKTQKRSTPVLTLSTFIFSCIEMLQGRPQTGLKLMYQAFQINKGDVGASSADQELLQAVLPYLFRCLLPLSIFGFDLSAEDRDRAKLHKVEDRFSGEDAVLHLMIELYDISYQAQKFCNFMSGKEPDADARKQKQQFVEQLLAWYAEVERSGTLQATGEKRRFLSQQLVVYHAAFVRLSCLWDTSPDVCPNPFNTCKPILTNTQVFEPHEESFKAVINEAERALAYADISENRIPFDLSVVPCLYYTSWACRKPSLRRKALNLLRDKAPRQENLWTADACIQLIELAIACEEGTDRFVPEIAEADDVYPPLEMRLPVGGQVTRLQMLVQDMVDVPSGLPISCVQIGRPWKGNKEWPESPISNILPHTFWRV